MARLEDVCEILDSKRVPITAKDRVAGPYPYYGANGVQDYVADYIFDALSITMHKHAFVVSGDKSANAQSTTGTYRWYDFSLYRSRFDWKNCWAWLFYVSHK